MAGLRLLSTAAACAAILGVAAGPAHACTCRGGIPPAERLAEAEAGFVGTVVSRRPAAPRTAPGSAT